MKAKIYITLKNGVLDPQGKAIAGTLSHMGFEGVNDVKQGKLIEIDLQEASEEEAKNKIEQMCEQLLANTVIENYSYEMVA